MSSIPPSTPVTASPAAVKVVKPKVGGIYDGIPFTSGPRDPQLARSFPSYPYMERDKITKMKVYRACENGIKEELRLRNWQRAICTLSKPRLRAS